ncbi:outer dense fiber protein 3 [Cyclospora cayetanensis]|uniref:Outer dense fiber protein 3 n=1 Tax=Cyclospora cayetanensis TaxID=88456 RepID=A0A6P6RY49_9EIME|nr:outer dense fiber protein 3 [Cyclospora cayetanensis]
MASLPVAEHNLACLSTVAAGPKWSFGGRPAHPVSEYPVPGPGAYSPHFELAKQNAPQYGCGHLQLHERIPPIERPGAYQPQIAGGRQAASWTMGSKLAPREHRSLTPGPGAYSNVVPKSSAPAYGVGTSTRGVFSASLSPGPGTYNPGTNFGSRSPQWSLGTSQRYHFTQGKSKFPGPGAYSPCATTRDGPMYSMGARITPRNSDLTPGPGTYTPRVPKKEANRFSFGSRTPQGHLTESAPGPGAYTPTERTVWRRPPAWGFGNSNRACFAVNSCPGPGQYNPQKKSGTPSWRYLCSHLCRVSPLPYLPSFVVWVTKYTGEAFAEL